MNDFGGGDQGDDDCVEPLTPNPYPKKMNFEGYLGRPDLWAKVAQGDPKWVNLSLTAQDYLDGPKLLSSNFALKIRLETFLGNPL